MNFIHTLIFNNDNILDEKREEQIKEFSLSDWVNWVGFLTGGNFMIKKYWKQIIKIFQHLKT